MKVTQQLVRSHSGQTGARYESGALRRRRRRAAAVGGGGGGAAVSSSWHVPAAVAPHGLA